MPAEPTLRRPRMENWGDEFRKARLQAKAHFIDGVCTWAAVAERISQITPVADSTLIRLQDRKVPPEQPGQRQLAYLALVALSYDPTEFDLTAEDRYLQCYTDDQIRKLLDPAHIPS